MSLAMESWVQRGSALWMYVAVGENENVLPALGGCRHAEMDLTKIPMGIHESDERMGQLAPA